MKKSLIVAGLLLAGANSLSASDYIGISYTTGSQTLDNSRGEIDIKGYRLSVHRNTDTYMLNGVVCKANAESSNVILRGESFSIEDDATIFGIGGGYKIINTNNIFIAPSLCYSKYSSSQATITKNSTGNSSYHLVGEEDSDNDLAISIVAGYQLNSDIDNFIYLDYTLDDDLLESKDHDDKNLEIGINYALDKNYILHCDYSKDMSDNEGTSNYNGFTIGLAVKF